MTSHHDEELTDQELAGLQAILTPAAPDVWGPHTLTYYGPGTRSILITGEIDEPTANAVCSQLRNLDCNKMGEQRMPIFVYINTPGGDVHQALAIYDVMRSIFCEVKTIVQGLAYSAGLILLQGGDARYAYKNSRLFYHESIAAAEILSPAMMRQLAHSYHTLNDQMKAIIQDRANINDETWYLQFGENCIGSYLSAEEALELGLLDGILEYPEKEKPCLQEQELDEKDTSSSEISPESSQTPPESPLDEALDRLDEEDLK